MISFAWPTERPHNATVLEVIDGDTIRCDIDLDLRVWIRGYSIRLLGCNAWEHDTEAGRAAKANLAALLLPGSPVVLTLVKDDKYAGRFDARVILPDGTDLIAQLIAQQWLAPWNGLGPRPLPPWPRTVTAPEGTP